LDKWESANFEDLLGKTLVEIKVVYENDDEDDIINFKDTEGKEYQMFFPETDYGFHGYLHDICGDLENLLNSPIVMAEESGEEENDDEDEGDLEYYEKTIMDWTFYKLATIKGYVTISWYSESLFYYTVPVYFKVKNRVD